MKPKLRTFKNGAYVTFEKVAGWYCVLARDPAGEVHDKIRCDSYRGGLDYFRAFCAIAKTL